MNYRVLQISGAIVLAALTALAASDRSESPKFAIGKVAPEIEGKDVDGKKFKLSEYRGKVVVLDFWGDW